MVSHAAVSIDEMRGKLHTLDYARTVLAATEPLSQYGFTVGDAVRFHLQPGWHHGIDARDGAELVDAVVSIGKGQAITDVQLTKDALLEAAAIAGIGKTYASKCPAELLEPQLNYWWREGLMARGSSSRDFQLLVAGQAGAAITKASVDPFSNLRLLDEALAGIEAKYGTGEVLVDYKFSHSLRRTHLRLIVPDYVRTITGTGTADDTWSVGLQIRNSLVGDEKTAIDGYLFRWWCTNGAIDTHSTSGTWSRRGGTSRSDVYEWARAAVDDVLGGLEPALDAVQAMVDMPIAGHANDVLRDIFEHYRVPVAERTRIIERMVDAGSQLNMYTVMQAVTQIANDALMDPAHVENLLRLGGDLPHSSASRCTECRRIV